jgi:hypothetical protein
LRRAPGTLALGLALSALASLAGACGGCGKSAPGSGASSATAGGSASAEGAPAARASESDASRSLALRDRTLWEHAKSGETEDLAALATDEGAVGLVEVAEQDPSLRPTALRAMAFARGWAQLPYLAKVAAGPDDAAAKLALGSAVDLATRPRRPEDPEDAAELRAGCESLAALAKDASKQPRDRRVLAVRALRMTPCPPSIAAGLPTDVDAR